MPHEWCAISRLPTRLIGVLLGRRAARDQLTRQPAIHRELIELAGPPDTEALRAAYRENLQQDENFLAYLKSGEPKRTIFPTRPDEKYAEEIADWEKRVAWRRELLEALPCASA